MTGPNPRPQEDERSRILEHLIPITMRQLAQLSTSDLYYADLRRKLDDYKTEYLNLTGHVFGHSPASNGKTLVAIALAGAILTQGCASVDRDYWKGLPRDFYDSILGQRSTTTPVDPCQWHNDSYDFRQELGCEDASETLYVFYDGNCTMRNINDRLKFCDAVIACETKADGP